MTWERHDIGVSGDGHARVHIVSIRLDQPGLRLAMNPADRSKGMEYVARGVSELLAERHAQLAVNASYFLPFRGGKDPYPKRGDPVGASGTVIADGEQISPPAEPGLDERVNAIICFAGSRVTITDGQQCPEGYSDGVAAGPRLLDAGRAVGPPTMEYCRIKYRRTALGISADRRRAWIIIVDSTDPAARHPGLDCADLTRLFLRLGASDAINMDGGGSATLAVEGADGLPKDLGFVAQDGVPGRERPVANAILLFVPHEDAGAVSGR